jgi:hypothetical protein
MGVSNRIVHLEIKSLESGPASNKNQRLTVRKFALTVVILSSNSKLSAYTKRRGRQRDTSNFLGIAILVIQIRDLSIRPSLLPLVERSSPFLYTLVCHPHISCCFVDASSRVFSILAKYLSRSALGDLRIFRISCCFSHWKTRLLEKRSSQRYHAFHLQHTYLLIETTRSGSTASTYRFVEPATQSRRRLRRTLGKNEGIGSMQSSQHQEETGRHHGLKKNKTKLLWTLLASLT